MRAFVTEHLPRPQFTAPPPLVKLAASAAIVVLSLAIGAAIPTGYAVAVATLAISGAALAAGLHNWRWSLYGLLAFIPLSGIPVIIAYPHTSGAVLLKDALFVVPAYLGFAAGFLARKGRITFPGAPVIPMGLLAALVFAQALNPSLPNLMVGAIGAKVWLLYIPLYFVGYHFVRDRADLKRVLTVMCLTALVPTIIGLLEAVLVTSGRAELVYRFYGDAAAAVTQDYAQLGYEGGSLSRIPSTFSFHAQFYAFTAAMVAVGYAWRRLVTDDTRWSTVGKVIWLLMLGAALTNGARGAFVFIPLLVLATVLIEGGRARVSPVTVGAPIVAFLGAAAIFGIAAGDLLVKTLGLVGHNFRELFWNGFRDAAEYTWFGIGTGSATNASRYAVNAKDLFAATDGRWFESWYVKVWVELGWPGLLLVLVLFGALVLRAAEAHRHLRDPQLRGVSAALIAFLIFTMVYAVKGQLLDFDPINIYFWLLAGILAKLTVLDRASPEPPSPRSGGA